MAAVLNVTGNGMIAAAKAREVETSNLASMMVNGYKQQTAAFKELAYKNERRIGTSGGEVGIVQIGMGAAFTNAVSDMSQGELKKTDNKFDVALDGAGFLTVTLPDGRTAYTRDGALTLNEEGNIVTAVAGFTVNRDLITVPTDGRDKFNIAPNGDVSVQDAVTNEKQLLGKLELARFLNPSGLERLGDNVYIQTNASGEPEFGEPGTDNFATTRQGFLEKSNVDPLKALLSVIEWQRVEQFLTKTAESDEAVHSSTMQNFA